MPVRLEVTFKPDYRDPLGESVRRGIIEDLGLNVEKVRTVEVYTIDAELTPQEVERVRYELFTDPVIQESSATGRLARDFSWVVEVGFRPGVTDNVGKTAREGIEEVLGRRLAPAEAVYTSRQYLLTGRLTRDEAERIAGDLLANSLIQRWEIRSIEDWAEGYDTDIGVPKVRGTTQPRVDTIPLDVSDAALMQLSDRRMLALSLEEMRAIRAYYGQPSRRAERRALGLSEWPTDVELEALAQTWSEHCKHKIFNAHITYADEQGGVREIDSLFKTCIVRATELISRRVDWLVSVFHDNAGVIRLNEDWNVSMKVETHNTPSALDPYGGALTGIVGVNRDPFGTGKGCQLLFNTDVLCFAPPDYSKPLPPRLMHPKRVFRGVHRGVRDGANQSGVPDVNGAILFDERFLGKPLVFCGTGGIMPATLHGQPAHEKRANPGDLIVMVGGRIGKDGIHGATFSSQELGEDSPVSAVQIGDPITQKKMFDFLLEARDQGLYSAITDNGAGGLSSSVGEMARHSKGCELHLDKAPLKYAGLQPWEILLSEAQERMTLAVPPEHVEALLTLAARRGVESTVLGRFTASGQFHALYNGQSVACLDMDFLHDGVPQMRLRASWRPPTLHEPHVPEPTDYADLLCAMLGRLNVCSKEAWVRQYDHEVQGTSVVKPFVGVQNDGPSDAAVLRPLLGSDLGLVVANGICPRYGDIDTYHMVACAIDEAVRNVIAVGGRIGRIAGLDNFCWPDPIPSPTNPDAEYKLAQLVRANQALYEYCLAYDLPCISGKDSMKNDYRVSDTKISIPPTLLFSVLGVIEDVTSVVTMDAKRPGDVVYVLGETRAELGGSEYYALRGHLGSSVPRVDAARARSLYEALSSAIARGLVASCHDCSDGGLGVALAETAFAGGFGVDIDLRRVPGAGDLRDDVTLFSESPSRFVVTVRAGQASAFESILAGSPCAAVGHVTELGVFRVLGRSGMPIIETGIATLKAAWQRPLNW
ncbi:MAG TPA: phosphoribosylformylglycinamidine synthase subunit PurS [Candidatus Tectomicrobia bacterium]|nr:phosphoribosylformylglycinamidine synthase subunit PurS [Candidatus Tectomicrobia bacterium]